MKFRKKPIVIDAVRWNGKIGDPACVQRPPSEIVSQVGDCGQIDTLEGPHLVRKGDWIITGVAGEHYPCKHEIFLQCYEPQNEVAK